MSIKRYAARRDANEAAIIDALTYVGATVLRLSEKNVPDLAVWVPSQSRWFMLEVKAKRGRLQPGQHWQDTIDPDAVRIVRTVEEALKAVGF